MHSRVPASLALALFVIAAQNLLASDWPQFRGPAGQGVSTARKVPLEWDTAANVAWSSNLPGLGWSSPVVFQDRIYLTTAVEDNVDALSDEGDTAEGEAQPSFSLQTLCLDVATGEVLWSSEITKVPAGTSIHSKNSHASPTPIVTADRVYVHFGTYGTAALDLQGNLVWKTRIEYNPVHGSGGSPLLFDDLLILNCDGGQAPFVVALDAGTGEQRWRAPRPEYPSQTFSFSTPLIIEVEGKPQLVSAGSHVVCSYDPKTGKELWSVRYPNKWSIVPRPVFAGGLVLVCTGYEGPAELLAIRPDGTGDVTETHVQWRADQFVPHNPSPVVKDNEVYLVSDRGIASCRDLKTGELHWKQRIGGNFSASPILAEQRVYFLSEEGVCTVIKAAAEFEQLAENDLAERTFASPAPLDGSLLIRTETRLYRVDSND